MRKEPPPEAEQGINHRLERMRLVEDGMAEWVRNNLTPMPDPDPSWTLEQSLAAYEDWKATTWVTENLPKMPAFEAEWARLVALHRVEKPNHGPTDE